MAIFPDITPAYGATKSSEPKLRKVQFGDGYEQRLRFGLNQNPKIWNLTWNNITKANADIIEAFLDARAADGDAFDWRPVDGGALGYLLTEDGDYLLHEDDDKIIDDDTLAPIYRWVCETWDKTLPYTGRATITATFRQVFEP